MDHSGVRPEAGVWAPEETGSGQDLFALGHLYPIVRAVALLWGPWEGQARAPFAEMLLQGMPLALELVQSSAQLPLAALLCFQDKVGRAQAHPFCPLLFSPALTLETSERQASHCCPRVPDFILKSLCSFFHPDICTCFSAVALLFRF